VIGAVGLKRVGLPKSDDLMRGELWRPQNKTKDLIVS